MKKYLNLMITFSIVFITSATTTLIVAMHKTDNTHILDALVLTALDLLLPSLI